MKSSSKNIYFASDFHLGVPSYKESLKREKALVAWLNEIKDHAEEIYLMGDVFDFWFEYSKVIPKGYVRLLGKLAEITDAGIPVYLFKGNHDIWAFDYLSKELNIRIHRKPIVKEIQGKLFYLAHGDGLGPGDYTYKFLKQVFESRLCQWFFKWLHPDIGTQLGLIWSNYSRTTKINNKKYQQTIIPLEDEILFKYSLKKHQELPNINYFIFGHQHIPIIHKHSENCELVILGDWITHFTYGVFDGEELRLEYFKN